MRKLNDLPYEAVQRNLERLIQLVKLYDNTIEVREGPFHDVLLYYAALFVTWNEQEIKSTIKHVDAGRLLKEARTLDTAQVDQIAGNWLTSRRKASKATGNVLIQLSKPTPIVVPVGTTFTVAGKTFKTTKVYTTRQESVSAESDRLMTQERGLGWTFTVPVEAVEAGTKGNIKRGTRLTPSIALSRNVTNISAAHDFDGGADEEDNAHLLGRISRGVTSKAISNRMTIESLLASKVIDLEAVSIIGAGDPEMQRDKLPAIPDGIGGRLDVYVRTTKLPKAKTIKLPASFDSTRRAWVCEVPNTFSGLYRIRSVSTTNGIKCAYTVRPVIRDCKAMYARPAQLQHSNYQTVQIETEPTNLLDDVTDVYVEIEYMPDIDVLQAAVDERDVCSPCDILIKAAIPCFTDITIDIDKHLSALNQSGIQQAVADYVNGMGFGGKLSTTKIAMIVQQRIPPGVMIRNITLRGELYVPGDDKMTPLTITTDNYNILTVPENYTNMISARTVAFFQEPTAVKIVVDGE